MYIYDYLRSEFRNMLETEEALQPESRSFDEDQLKRMREILEQADKVNVLYVLTNEDIEQLCDSHGFDLAKADDEDLFWHSVQKGIEFGLGDAAADVVETAVTDAWSEYGEPDKD
jgi:hypothetical protein